MSIKYLSSSGLTEVWSNIKTYIASKIPSKIITGLSIKGRTITYTNSDGTTGTLTTQDTDTTYTSMSAAEATTGTATTARSISAKVLHDKITSITNTKANDSNVVHKSGTETIVGTKTFSSWQTINSGLNVRWITGNKEQQSLYIWGSMDDEYRGLGAHLELHGDDEHFGTFVLNARDRTVAKLKQLIGSPDGTLTWDGKKVLTEGNSVTVDTNQTITGEKTFRKTIHVDSLTGLTGNNVGMYAGDLNASYSMVKTRIDGTIAINCVNATTKKSSTIDLKPDGTFTWNGGNVLTDGKGVTLNTAQTITGTKTFSNVIFSNKELRYIDTKYDWTDTSLNTWCDAGHVSWFDKTNNRRMHELVGTNGGVWQKACYINENPYFAVNSNRHITYWGNTIAFNGTTTFTGNVFCNGISYLKMTDLENSTTPPTSARYKHIRVVANDGSQVGDIQFCKRADGSFDTTIYSVVGSSNEGTLRVASNNEVYPLNNKTKLGISTFKWSEVWANAFKGNYVICTDGNAFMAQRGGYTFLIRNDGSNTYFLMSDRDGTPGTWSTARPLTINNATGICSINGNADTATNATYTNWLRTSSHTDHLFHTEWDGSYFWTYVTASDGGYRAVRVARSDSSGSADTATKATQDSAGQQINTTYIKGVSFSGRTFTFTRGNGTTFAITIHDNVVINTLANSFGSTGVGGICFVSGRTKNNIGGFGADVAGSDIHLVHSLGFDVSTTGTGSNVIIENDYDSSLYGTWRLLGSVSLGPVNHGNGNAYAYKRWTLAIRIA